MTLQDWSDTPELAKKLAELLSDPVMKAALEIIEKNTAAKTYGPTQLVTLGDRCTALFGYDTGRASVIQDLQELAASKIEFKQHEATYTDEKPPQ